MCLIAIAWKTDNRWPLILAGNRDEFHARPTDPAGSWHGAPDIIGGRDLTAGGSWLGVNAAGRFAAVTNYRERLDPPADARSRGQLVGDFLRGDATPQAYLAAIAADADRYAGFSLFVGDCDSLGFYSNRGGEPRTLDPGIYVLSNAALDAPWPKSERLREQFARQAAQPDAGALLAMLYDREPAPVGELPDTGLAPERERLLSAPFIVSPEYGTRASSVVLRDGDGRITFVERGFDPAGCAMETRKFVFRAS